MTMREILLPHGLVALVDAEDYEELSQHRWHVRKGRGTYYARRHVRAAEGSVKTIEMHRIILNAPKGSIVDHIDGNGLNNCKSNLRFVTRSQNQWNSRQHRPGTSKYKGVSWNSRHKKWHAQIQANKQRQTLGYYATEEEAAQAYLKAAQQLHGAFVPGGKAA